MTKKVVRIFEGKSKKISQKQAKICKNVYILVKTLDIFSSGSAVGSTTPGPALALYAPGFNSNVDAIITSLFCVGHMRCFFKPHPYANTIQLLLTLIFFINPT